ncbi:MAG: PEP/pyruvate-binding domain-containing protein, partial [Candidatus Riflebacteria bacterium]
MNFILNSCECRLIKTTGGKGANLFRIVSEAKLDVPEFLVLSTEAFFYFINQNGLKEKIRLLCSNSADSDKTIENLLSSTGFPDELNESIKHLFDH